MGDTIYNNATLTGVNKMKTLDLGNNEQISRGVVENNDGTFTKSREFKTLKSAIKFMERHGFNADGSRIAA